MEMIKTLMNTPLLPILLQSWPHLLSGKSPSIKFRDIWKPREIILEMSHHSEFYKSFDNITDEVLYSFQ